MANVVFVGQDLSVPTYSVTAPFVVDANYPLTNVQTYYAADQCRSTSLAGAQMFNITFATATQCDTLVLENCYFGNADSVDLQCDTSSAFSGGGLVTNANLVDPSTTATSPYMYTFTAQTKTNWRLRINLASGSLAAVPQIGNIFLCKRLDFGIPYAYPYKVPYRKHKTNSAEMLDGRIRTTNPYAGRKYMELTCNWISDTVRSNYGTFVDTVRGAARPFYMIDADGSTIYYVHFDSDTEDTQVLKYNFNTTGKIIVKKQLVG